MSIYLYHDQPHLLSFEAEIVATRPGAIALSVSALHPGGGGQVSDRAEARHQHGAARIMNVVQEDGRYWHVLDRPDELQGKVEIRIDEEHRFRVSQLHTDTHILNALVFQSFSGALVTGCQINADGTARMDFDLPAADNDLLRGLEPLLNDRSFGKKLRCARYTSPQMKRGTLKGLSGVCRWHLPRLRMVALG
jgi:misacylated tRNA(Ala) deacylase